MSRESYCERMYLCFLFVACAVLYVTVWTFFPRPMYCVLDLKVLLYSTSLPQASTAFSLQ